MASRTRTPGENVVVIPRRFSRSLTSRSMLPAMRSQTFTSSGLNITISSMRLMNSGRKKSRSASCVTERRSTSWRLCRLLAAEKPMRVRIESIFSMPRLLVIRMSAWWNATVWPLLSVMMPSSSNCSSRLWTL